MVEYFRPWRRRVGICTLVLACAAAAGWIRGLSTFDRVCFADQDFYSVFHFSNETLGSNLGIYLLHGRITDQAKPPRTEWISNTRRLTREQIQEIIKDYAAYKTAPEAIAEGFWSLEWCEFVIGGTNTYWCAAVPYWSIVMPLTALSAGLLLSKSCPSKSNTPAEPVPETAA